MRFYRCLPLACALIGLGAATPATAQVDAGYNGGFYIRDADGDFEIRIGGVFQTRYVVTSIDDGDDIAPDDDRDLIGFQLRRTQLDLQGFLFDPRLTWRLRFDASNGGDVSAGHAWLAYTTEAGTSVRLGQLKANFLQEENVGGSTQLAAERSYTSDYFTTDFVHGFQIARRLGDRVSFVGTIHDGSYSAKADYAGKVIAVAVTGRTEFLLHSDEPARGWRQFGDFQHWTGEPAAAMLGAAVDFERAYSEPDAFPDIRKWTVDLTGKVAGLTLFGAVVGQTFSSGSPVAPQVPPGIGDSNQLGVTGLVSYFVLPDALDTFIRFDRADFDGVYYRLSQGGPQGGSRDLDEDVLSVLTVGANWYFRRHNAKLTADVIHALDAVPVGNGGGTLLRSEAGGQTAVRVQAQVRF
jgi:hypothetical protein